MSQIAVRIVFAAIAIGLAAYGLSALRSGEVTVRHLKIERHVDAQGFRFAISFVWLIAAICAVSAILFDAAT
jgi:hypothetical protein